MNTQAIKQGKKAKAPSQERIIVLCSDGTWNRGGPGAPTNVWRMHEAIDRSLPWVTTAHDNGVGTGQNVFSKFLGGAFGFGLYKNVRDLYAFLIRHYQPGDRIFLFGFSRGAFTVRLLGGIINHFGVVDRKRFPDDPDRAAQLVVRSFRLIHAQSHRDQRDSKFHSITNKLLGDPLPEDRSQAAFVTSFKKRYCHAEVPIAFMGVWDTVRAFGGPFDELVDCLNTLFCTSFSDTYLPERVQVARQALAIDEPRQTFEAIPWKPKPCAQHKSTGLSPTCENCERDEEDGRLCQRWFVGAHSDVGGGYQKQGLAAQALLWMMEEACKHGLPLTKGTLRRIRAEANPLGKLHDPRAGKGFIYRFRARQLPKDAIPHETVRTRINKDAGGYSPGNVANYMFKQPASQGTQHNQTPFSRILGAQYLRSSIHILTVTAFLLLLAFAWFAEQIPPTAKAIPKVFSAGLDLLEGFITHLIPFDGVAKLLTRPITELQTRPNLFYTLFGVLVFGLLVCYLMRGHMRRKARAYWNEFRGSLVNEAEDSDHV